MPATPWPCAGQGVGQAHACGSVPHGPAPRLALAGALDVTESQALQFPGWTLTRVLPILTCDTLVPCAGRSPPPSPSGWPLSMSPWPAPALGNTSWSSGPGSVLGALRAEVPAAPGGQPALKPLGPSSISFLLHCVQEVILSCLIPPDAPRPLPTWAAHQPRGQRCSAGVTCGDARLSHTPGEAPRGPSHPAFTQTRLRMHLGLSNSCHIKTLEVHWLHTHVSPPQCS